MKISLTFSFSILLALFMGQMTLCGQTKDNPFDLKYRTKRPHPGIKLIPDTTSPPIQVPMPQPEQPAIEEAASEPAQVIVDSTVKETKNAVVQGDTAKANEQVEKIPTTIERQSRRNAENARKTFLLFILLAVALISTLVISYNRNIIQKIWRAIQNDNYLNFVYREEKSNLSLQYVFLYIIFFINAGLFLYLSSLQLLDSSNPVLWKCILFLISIYLVRHFFMDYLIRIYPFKKEAGQFNFTILIFNVFLGLILLPINAFVTFAPEVVANGVMYAGFVICGLLFILRQLRGILIGINFLMGRRFYFFLYLCATEVAPMFLIIKFFHLFIG